MTAIKNETLSVEINEKTLNVKITDLRNNTVWSTPSGGFHLKIHDIGCQNSQWYRSDKSSDCRISVINTNEKEASFQIDFHTLDLGFVCTFALDEDELTLRIPEETWNLSGEKMLEVLALDCLPLFGGRQTGHSGYMVLPHMGGVIRYFSDISERPGRMKRAIANDARSPFAFKRLGSEPSPRTPQVHTGKVYGQQSQWKDMITYPLWGVVDGNAGWCAYVPFECGDADMSVITSANIGPEKRCSVHCRFDYREHAHDIRIDEDRELVLTFLDQENLNYAAFGRRYRTYITKKAGYPTLQQKYARSPQGDYMAGAGWVNCTLALKRYSNVNNPNPDGKGILDVYMTCDELTEELRRWKQAGVEKLALKICGFNYEGHDGNYPTVFPIEPGVGGEEGFRRLLAAIKELDYRIFPHLDLRLYSRAAPDFRIEHVIRDCHGGLLIEASGPEGDVYHACPAAIRREFLKKAFQPLSAFGINGGMYIDFVLGILFRCYHPGHPLPRRGYLNAVRAYAQDAINLFGSLRMESVIAPILDLVDAVARIYVNSITEAAMASSKLVQQGLADEAVPLQAIIFHGQLLYCTGSTCFHGQKDHWKIFLENVSVGAIPCEEIRGPQPQWDELHVLEYRVLCKYMKYLKFEWLENIEKWKAATKSSYSDGTVVWVNHGKEDTQVDGQLLKGRSLRIIPGGKDRDILTLTEDRSMLDREPVPIRDGTIWPGECPREGLIVDSYEGKVVGAL